MKRFLLALLLLSPLVFPFSFLFADDETENAGAIWTEVNVTKALPYNLSIEGSLGHRTLDWFDESNRFDASLGLSWKASKHWKLGLGYVFIMKHYPSETSYKTSTEFEHKYRNVTTGENEDYLEYFGNPYTDENGVQHTYRGYNEKLKNDKRIDESFWRQRHRFFVEASYTNKFWKTLRVTIRERYQLTHVPRKILIEPDIAKP